LGNPRNPADNLERTARIDLRSAKGSHCLKRRHPSSTPPKS